MTTKKASRALQRSVGGLKGVSVKPQARKEGKSCANMENKKIQDQKQN
jgi:hypothetical protein